MPTRPGIAVSPRAVERLDSPPGRPHPAGSTAPIFAPSISKRRILDRRRAGAVDDPQMLDRDLSGRDMHERLNVGAERGWRSEHRRGRGRSADRKCRSRRE